MRYAIGLAFAGLVTASVLLALGPMYFLSATRAQSFADIERGYQVSLVAPSLTLIALVLGIAFAAMTWRAGAGPLTKIAVVAGCVALSVSSYYARGSFTERMFSPLPEVVRVPAAASTHVEANDLVLGVKHAGESAAYPVPIIAYHHIVNDRLGDEPFVVTY